MTTERVIVVAKRTAYSKFVEEDRDPIARELLRRSDPSVRRWRQAHQDHIRTLERVEHELQRVGVKSWVVHGPHTVFDPGDAALVVTVGGDGTLLAASHHVSEIPILGVNSSPSHSIGFFCGARISNLRSILRGTLEGKSKATSLARMRVEVSGRLISRRVLNEALFCHAIPAATSRYILSATGKREEQRSSGIWIGTAAGSTGALRSAGGRILPLLSRQLQVVVREPYNEGQGAYRLRKLLVAEGGSISVKNKMQNSWLFLDGPYMKTRVALGEKLSFSISDQPLSVIGIDQRRRQR